MKIDALTLENSLKKHPLIDDVFYFESCASTIDQAIEYCKRVPGRKALFLSETVTQGRGLKKRTWEAPQYQGLYFTLLMPFSLQDEWAPLSTLCAGLAVQETYETLFKKHFMIKWPNDIYFEGKKCGGILSQILKEKHKNYLIMGIGLNINTEEQEFSEEIKLKASSLKIIFGKSFDRLKILQALLPRLFTYLHLLEKEGPKALAQQFIEKSRFIGQSIKAFENEEIIGEVIALNPFGQLQIKTNAGEIKTLLSGDIELLDNRKDSSCY